MDFEDRRAQRESCTQCLRAQGTRRDIAFHSKKKSAGAAGAWAVPLREENMVLIYIYIYMIPVPGSLAPPNGMVYIDSQEDTNHRLNQ